MAVFQSAPPVKGAIRRLLPDLLELRVSIRAPREGAMSRPQRSQRLCKFQSAPPVKGAMQDDSADSYSVKVSIRAPREGGDAKKTVSLFS